MYSTEQENFWAGQFGNDYVDRNIGTKILASKTGNFARFLRKTSGINSCLEIGCNVGLNLEAIKRLLPDCKLNGIEINEKAAEQARQIKDTEIFCGSVFDYPVKENSVDLAFTSGVLIHINPEKLNDVYDLLYKASRKYILISEYYNPTPTEVIYRGNAGKLFKRDFAGELLDKFTPPPATEASGATETAEASRATESKESREGLRLIDYGFVYHRDENFPDDDVTWFLMEKVECLV